MTHDEAHKAAVEGATMAVFMSRAEGDDIVATAAITAYLAEMEAAGFVVARVPGKAYPNTVEGADWCGGFNTAIAAMLASRPKVTP